MARKSKRQKNTTGERLMKKKIFIITSILALIIALPVFYQLVFTPRTVNLTEWVFTITIAILILAIPIISLFSIRGLNSEEIFNKKRNIVFFILNIIIFVVSAFLIGVEIKSMTTKIKSELIN